MKNLKQLFSRDSHSILNSINGLRVAKVEENTVFNFFKFFFFLVVFFILIFYFSQKSEDIKIVKIAEQDIKVELARTIQAQQQGLSGRENLEENAGMLFVFENPGIYYFWMKDMNFPIDMIWINEEQKIVYIKKNIAPLSFPERFGNDKNAKYVLEVNANFSDKNNIKEGDSVEFFY